MNDLQEIIEKISHVLGMLGYMKDDDFTPDELRRLSDLVTLADDLTSDVCERDGI